MFNASVRKIPQKKENTQFPWQKTMLGAVNSLYKQPIQPVWGGEMKKQHNQSSFPIRKLKVSVYESRVLVYTHWR